MQTKIEARADAARGEGQDTGPQAPNVAGLVLAAQAAGGTVVQTTAGTIIVLPARRDDGEDLVALPEAARIAATSLRVVREAIQAGNLTAYGKQRDRAIKRADLARWIESRRAPVERGADDEDIARRVRRLRVVKSGGR